MKSFNSINATVLREISENIEVNIEWILNRCLDDAEAGEDHHIHNDYLSEKQAKVLTERGFDITNLTTDEPKFIIRW